MKLRQWRHRHLEAWEAETRKILEASLAAVDPLCNSRSAGLAGMGGDFHAQDFRAGSDLPDAVLRLCNRPKRLDGRIRDRTFSPTFFPSLPWNIGSRLKRVCQTTVKAGGYCLALVRCDVTKPEDRRAVRDHFERRYGKVDILINKRRS